MVLSGITDVLDGRIARRFSMVSDFGEILDPIADKLTQLAMLFCLFFRFPYMLIPLVLMVLRESFDAITSLFVIHKTGKVFSADWHWKVTTTLFYALIFIHLIWQQIPPVLSYISIGVCSVMMLVSLVLYGLRNISAIRRKAL